MKNRLGESKSTSDDMFAASSCRGCFRISLLCRRSPLLEVAIPRPVFCARTGDTTSPRTFAAQHSRPGRCHWATEGIICAVFRNAERSSARIRSRSCVRAFVCVYRNHILRLQTTCNCTYTAISEKTRWHLPESLPRSSAYPGELGE